MQVSRFDQEQTAQFLSKIRQQLKGYRIDLVWDNASFHGGHPVQEVFLRDQIREHRLSACSPQMNAPEYFIRWAKQTLSDNFYWKELVSLKYAFRAFLASLERKAKEVLKRWRPKMLGFKIA